ncbi:MAG: radical SAM protein [bacterium]|nr:radical SAM protein [bacterium]
MKPAYLLSSQDKIKEKRDALYRTLSSCNLCPRECKVNRLEGKKGYCGANKELVVSSISPHFGEESELVGSSGSGTIFFSHCSLKCIFCQNYEISHLGYGRSITEEELAEAMLSLAKIGCININLVTPTHYLPQILSALLIAKDKGLKLPIVYNSSGYERVETLRLIEGIIDIYMPDMKYGNPEAASKYSNACDYPELAKKALLEMYRQVGDLEVCDGIAKRGLLVRHLIMPSGVADTKEVIRFVASISKDTYINIMDQYRPLYEAHKYPEIARKISYQELCSAIEEAKKKGLHRGFSLFVKLRSLVRKGDR